MKRTLYPTLEEALHLHRLPLERFLVREVIAEHAELEAIADWLERRMVPLS